LRAVIRRAVIQQDVIRQTATAQLLAHLFQGQLTTFIGLVVKPGIDLERQQSA
jgi:hypothetical protein